MNVVRRFGKPLFDYYLDLVKEPGIISEITNECEHETTVDIQYMSDFDITKI